MSHFISPFVCAAELISNDMFLKNLVFFKPSRKGTSIFLYEMLAAIITINK